MSTSLLSWIFDSAQIASLLQQNWQLGLALVGCIVFIETGVVILPFLPGDSLLFATGAAFGIAGVSPAYAVVAITAAAILGDSLNFYLGSSAVGPRIVRKGWIKQKYLDQTRAFFDKHGPKTITIGRFVPIVRTIAPFLAGMGGMKGRVFAVYNVAGGVIWCTCLVMAGYWLGGIPWVAAHMGWLTIAIIVVSLVPVAIELWRARAAERH